MSFIKLLIVAAAFFLTEVVGAVSPPIRATHYSGGSRIVFSNQKWIKPTQLAFTIETWVYRKDETGCETILEFQTVANYYFATCPTLRFGNGASSVVGNASVPSGRWTHVAVAYSGSGAQFFIDGAPAGGGGPLPFFVDPPQTHSLTVGSRTNGAAPLNGYLDELRIWSVARTEEQINSRRFIELTDSASEDGLQAVFHDGGQREDLSRSVGIVVGEPKSSGFGVLPRDLVVPLAAVIPSLDGNVSVQFEYAGAEQIVLRFEASSISNVHMDVPGYLVRTETDLFIGVPSVALLSSDWSAENSRVVLLLDPNLERGNTVRPSQARLMIGLRDESSATAVWQVGDGTGSFTNCSAATCPQPGIGWEVRKRFTGDDVGIMQLSLEIRISKTVLGDWSEPHGLAFGQITSADPPEVFLAPLEARSTVPLTWAVTTYTAENAVLPRAIVEGAVLDATAAGSPPIAGHTITFGSIGTVTHHAVTGADGRFGFNVPVPGNYPLELRAEGCAHCQFAPSTFSGGGTNAASQGKGFVMFPGCDNSSCTYRTTQFRLKRPPGETTISSPPAVPRASMLLNSSTGAATPTSTTTVTGGNFHEDITLYISPESRSADPSNWVLYPVVIGPGTVTPTSMEVQVPTLPRLTRTSANSTSLSSTLNIRWRWVIRDNWVRDGWRDVVTSAGFVLLQPNYADLYGFAFDNQDDNGSLKEFLSVYGGNAYICVGAFGFCATHVPDPLYFALAFPLYKLAIGNSGGSCVGFAATSLLMHSGHILPWNLNPDVQFPAGFPTAGRPARWHHDGPLEMLVGPTKPANLWAHIRQNHGIQISAQVFGEIVDQVTDSSVDGFMRRQRNKIASKSKGYVVSMKDPNETFGGHSVTPYDVDGNRVLIYDNEFPLNDGRFIELGNNTFQFRNWPAGSLLFTLPIAKWRGEHSFPTNIPDLLTSMVFGSSSDGADVLFSTSAGAWGRASDGSFVDTRRIIPTMLRGARRTIPSLIPVLIPGQTVSNNHSPPILTPLAARAPTISVTARSDKYFFLSGAGGTIVQMEVSSASARARDLIALAHTKDRLEGFDFKPERETRISAAVGMSLGKQQRLLFQFMDLSIPPGATAKFRASPALRAASHVNASDSDSEYFVTVQAVDGAARATSTQLFGPLVSRAGSTQRIAVANWPKATILRVQEDANGDGNYESSRTVIGRDCASSDDNEDGVPDSCATVR
jgi:hypothetical protein